MNAKQAAGLEARKLLLHCYDGVLSTVSRELPGYPFGSVVPFALDRTGHPVLLVASIAQHTGNMVADGRVSLIVFDRSAPDLQNNGRLTLLADACPVASADEETAARYYRYFPESRDYHRTHDFAFWRLIPRRARYIGGFGSIHWLDADAVLAANPFSAGDERQMVEHMNQDHVVALRHYCVGASIEPAADETPTMAGIDGFGFHVRVGPRLVRFSFPHEVTSPQEARQALVAMARG